MRRGPPHNARERRRSEENDAEESRNRSVGDACWQSAGCSAGVFATRRRTGRPAAPPAALSADQALAGFSLGDTEGLVRQLQGELQQNPKDAKNLALLGLAYQQLRERPETPPTTRSRRACSPGSRDRPKRPAGDERARLARARPPSVSAMPSSWARRQRRSRRRQPRTTASSATRSSSSAATARVRHVRQDGRAQARPPVYSRVSYARELLGDHQGATRR